jgi:hypothetical protein
MQRFGAFSSRYLQAEEVGAVLRELIAQKSETAMESSGLR